jgi:hypothetical protein
MRSFSVKIEAKLLASLRTPELKKIRAPNFFIFSTDSEKSLLDPEPVGRLLKTKKSSTIREKCAIRNSREIKFFIQGLSLFHRLS